MMEGGRDYFNNNDEEHKGRELKLCAGVGRYSSHASHVALEPGPRPLRRVTCSIWYDIQILSTQE